MTEEQRAIMLQTMLRAVDKALLSKKERIEIAIATDSCHHCLTSTCDGSECVVPTAESCPRGDYHCDGDCECGPMLDSDEYTPPNERDLSK